MLVHAVRTLSAARSVSLVVVAAPPGDVPSVRALLADHGGAGAVEVVAGGPTRGDSVRAALAVLGPQVDVVLVHDAARPLAPTELVDAVAAAVHAGSPAVVPVLPVVDTVKRVDAAGRVLATLDRAALRAVQTPQGFRRGVLEQAHAGVSAPLGDSVTGESTDDAGLVERAGIEVVVVPGAEEAFKVTTPLDLQLAEVVLRRRRVSHGA